ncbi:hypothetical protein [Pandoraea apista]|uniref:hypothetical protein n=1 Tax=Pandoraea apista TaxID=93218 RepID=UPI002F935320
MDDKHTPGPWRVSEANPKIVIEDRLPFYSEGRIVAKVSSYPGSGFFFSDEDAVDHARLIAAAPELSDLVKEARKAMAEYLEDHPHSAPHDCYATGPVTGNAVHDLVRCPGCCAHDAFTSLVAKIDAALSKARGEA